MPDAIKAIIDYLDIEIEEQEVTGKKYKVVNKHPFQESSYHSKKVKVK
jgi:hypothetical protein